MKTLTIICAGLLLLACVGWVNSSDRNSFDYKLGWSEGRADALSEASGMDQVRQCVESRRGSLEKCWSEQIDAAKEFYKVWGSMTDEQKIAFGAMTSNHRWTDNLKSANPYDLQAYIKRDK